MNKQLVLVLTAIFLGANGYGQLTNPPAGIIETVAGDGVQGFSGDGGPATQASLSWGHGIAVDAPGNLYIADTQNCRIRKVSAATGMIATIAGTSCGPVSGWSGPATAAGIGAPVAVAVDGLLNVYVLSATRLSKISASDGSIVAIAGTGSAGFAGDGGPAAAAQFRDASGVAVDSLGDLYIADSGNHRIRKITSSGVITTIAGTGEAGFAGDGGPAVAAELNAPASVAVDGSGSLFIADSGNRRIREVNGSAGTISTIAGTGVAGFSGDGGAASVAEIGRPNGIAVDGAGNVYFADASNSRVRQITFSDGRIWTIAGNGEAGTLGDFGPAVAAQLESIYGVAVNALGYVYILQAGTGSIRALGPGAAQNPTSYAVQITSSDPQPVMGEVVTLAAKVTSNLNLPAIRGAIAWFNGSTSLGTTPVDTNGTSSIIVSLSLGGTQTITATFQGDAGGFGSIELPVRGFALAGPASSALSVASGSATELRLAANAYNGFSGAIDLTCSGLPTPGACRFTREGIDLGPSVEIDLGPEVATAAVVVSLNTTRPTLASTHPGCELVSKLALAFLCPLILLGTRSRSWRFLQVALLAIGMTIFGSGMTGCGRGTAAPVVSPATPNSSLSAGTYTVNVVAKASSGTLSYPITLTVK